MEIQRLTRLVSEECQPLIDASVAEGYSFVQQLWSEFESGKNRFDEPGALLLGIYDGDQLVAVGGVHPDPYLGDPRIGRIRHVYVLPSHRRQGLGQRLGLALLERNSDHFDVFTLRTLTAHGHAFYIALGFSDAPRFEEATHWRTGQADQQ